MKNSKLTGELLREKDCYKGEFLWSWILTRLLKKRMSKSTKINGLEQLNEIAISQMKLP